MRARRSLTAALALTLACCVLSTPTALAGPREKELTRPTIVRVSDRGGFDWADAGVGAAGGVALSVLGVGVALLLSERQRSHPST